MICPRASSCELESSPHDPVCHGCERILGRKSKEIRDHPTSPTAANS